MRKDLLESDLLYNFISPVTGRVLCDFAYVLVGDPEGRATPSPVLIDLFADFIDLKKVVNQIISGTIIIPIDTLPDLPYRRIWLGNVENRPEITGLAYQNVFTGDIAGDIVTTVILDINNMANLPAKRVWYGVNDGTNDRPVPTGLGAKQLFIGNPDNSGDILIQQRLIDDFNLPPLATKFIWYGTLGFPLQVPFSLALAEAISGTAAQVAVTPPVPAFLSSVGAPTDPVVISLVDDVIITNSVQAGNLKMGTNIQSISANSNITLAPNGTGLVDMTTRRVINVSNPVNPLDVVNLQTLQTYIGGAGTVTSVTGTANQITVVNPTTTPVISLPSDVIITNSVQAGNIKIITNTITSTNTNGTILISPNGLGNVDVTNHKIINVANPVNPLDAVNLQTLQSYAGTVTSVTGTVNQITVVNPTTTPVISMPADVIVTNSVRGGNIRIGNTNNIESINTNGNINVLPNGTGLVGVGTSSPSYLLDVNGTTRTRRLLGNGGVPTVVLGAAGVIGTGATSSITGTEVAGRFTLNTGTGLVLVGGVVATFTLTSAMPSGTFSISLTPANGNASGRNLFVTSISSTQFTLNITGLTLLALSTTYIWNYTITGY